MRSGFELYNSTWGEIDGFLSSKYNRLESKKSHFTEYRGKVIPQAKENLLELGYSVKLKIQTSENGKFKRVDYSANLLLLQFIVLLALLFLAILIQLTSDSWVVLFAGLPYAILGIISLRYNFRRHLEAQVELDKNGIISMRER